MKTPLSDAAVARPDNGARAGKIRVEALYEIERELNRRYDTLAAQYAELQLQAQLSASRSILARNRIPRHHQPAFEDAWQAVMESVPRRPPALPLTQSMERWDRTTWTAHLMSLVHAAAGRVGHEHTLALAEILEHVEVAGMHWRTAAKRLKRTSFGWAIHMVERVHPKGPEMDDGFVYSSPAFAAAREGDTYAMLREQSEPFTSGVVRHAVRLQSVSMPAPRALPVLDEGLTISELSPMDSEWARSLAHKDKAP